MNNRVYCEEWRKKPGSEKRTALTSGAHASSQTLRSIVHLPLEPDYIISHLALPVEKFSASR
jgi:hypothetical protein